MIEAERWRVTLSSIGDAVIVTDAQSRVTFMNPVAESLTGWSLDEAEGRPLDEVFVISNEETGQPAPNPVTRVLATGYTVGLANHTVLTARDGARHPIDDSASPIPLEGGGISGVVLVFRDVTEQRRAASEAAFRAAIVDSSDDAIVTKDLNGIVTTWNAAAERIFGYTAEEMIGTPILRLIPEDRPNEEPSILERISRGERVDHYETVRRRKDGSTFDISVTISPVKDEGGRIIGASKVGRDISEQKKLERLLRAYANDLADQHHRKDEFLAMLAHELRNPLAPMRTAVEILRLQATNPAQIQRARETLDRQINNMVRLVGDLLDVSRFTAGKISLQIERLDLAALIRENCEDCRAAAEAAGLTFECVAPDVPVWVTGDRTRLDQVLDNLIENALKFTDSGGIVKVSLSSGESTAVVTVRDSGIGIAAPMLPQLFDIFIQGNQSLARSRGGLGLGLAIVKGITELHGGKIEVHSDGEGKGAEFRVTLPILAEPPAFVGKPSSLPRAAGNLRVLLIEDNKDAADTLAELMRLSGYDVRVAYTGRAGLEEAKSFLPQVVISDIGLPEMDGYEVARQLRGLPDAPARLIALTGYGAEMDRERVRSAGFDRHFVKPVEADRLLAELSISASPAS